MQVVSESILSKSREQWISDVRSLYAFVAVRKAGTSNKTLAEFLGKEISSISKMVRRIEMEVERDKMLADDLHRIIQVIQA